MNKKDQQLIAEAYKQIVEAAPQTVGSRVAQGLKGWALNKFGGGILSPFLASSKERLDAENQAHQEINTVKARLEATYRQQYGKSYSDARGAPNQFVKDFIKSNMGVDLNDPQIDKFLRTDPVSDRNINEALKQAYAQKTRLQGGRNSDKYKFGQMLSNIKQYKQTTGNHLRVIKQIMGDYTKKPDKEVKYVNMNGKNPLTLEQIVNLLKSNNPNNINRAIGYLQKFDDDLD